jgi:hypothetical protein
MKDSNNNEKDLYYFLSLLAGESYTRNDAIKHMNTISKLRESGILSNDAYLALTFVENLSFSNIDIDKIKKIIDVEDE